MTAPALPVRADEVVLKGADLCWRQLPALPDPKGLAATFAGVHRDALLVAGGANFPDRMPWDGGQKKWHDRVWVLQSRTGGWREVGRLPRPLAYGVSITTAEGVVCIGGSDAEGHRDEVFRLAWREGKLETTSLPSLPRPLANACGALLDTTVYVAGGIATPNATSTSHEFFALDLAEEDPTWEAREPWPGPPRMLAVAAVMDGRFFLVSGTDLSADEKGMPARTYLVDSYCYSPHSGWKRISDVPHPVVAAPSPAVVAGASRFLVFSGDDGTKLGFQPPQHHPGFNRTVLMYDAEANTWTRRGEVPAPHVTAPVVQWGRQWLIVSGEIRPGVRSPEIWGLRMERE